MEFVVKYKCRAVRKSLVQGRGLSLANTQKPGWLSIVTGYGLKGRDSTPGRGKLPGAHCHWVSGRSVNLTIRLHIMLSNYSFLS